MLFFNEIAAPCVVEIFKLWKSFLFEGQVALHDPFEGVLELLIWGGIAERVDRAKNEIFENLGRPLPC